MLTYIEITRLHPHPQNPRRDLGDLSELAESIKERGVLQNLTVTPWNFVEKDKSKWDSEYDRFVVVIGHRRLAAAKLAGLTELPCVVADMDERAQMATMLMENIQRSDLTAYEQAQGFQMLIDLGDSVNDIAGRTGFSETTVRRRVKLLELDADKFKKADARGATLMDYAELEKIKDLGRKNSVLEKIGTDNFKYALRQAIDTEIAEAREAEWRAALSAFATEVDDDDTIEYRQVKWFGRSEDTANIRPDDADTVAYFFNISKYGMIYLLVARGEKSAEDPEAVKRRERLEYRKKELDGATTRAYVLRKEFIQSVGAAKVKKTLADIITFAVMTLAESYDFDVPTMAEMIGAELDEENELIAESVYAAVQKSPERALLAMVYCASDDNARTGFWARWNDKYQANEQLDRLYDLLEKLGYGMSDEEKALRDGTHELFGEGAV
jgi:ParB family chromosome partitioning protein